MTAILALVLLMHAFHAVAAVAAVGWLVSPSSPCLAVAARWRRVLVLAMEPVPGRAACFAGGAL